MRRAEIAAHRIQGDLHWWETLRTKASDCKAKNGGACAKRLFYVGSWHSRRLDSTSLRVSTPVAHGNNHTTDKRYAKRLRCHIAGICIATGRKIDSLGPSQLRMHCKCRDFNLVNKFFQTRHTTQFHGLRKRSVHPECSGRDADVEVVVKRTSAANSLCFQLRN